MVRRRHFVIGGGNGAVRGNQNGFARCNGRIGLGNAIGSGHGAIAVAQQIIRIIELVLERLVGFGRIETDAQNYRILIFEVLNSITEPAAFDGSPGCVGFRVPPDQHIFAGGVRKADGTTILVWQRKSRS